jgi:nucleotide-binding universal stress UspA family protein
MFRTILLCYDGSREGRNALREGADVALSMHAQAHLLAIIRGTALTPPEGVSEARMLDDAHTADTILREGMEWLKARGLPAEGRLVFGNPLREIPACARELDADLIVIGHRKRGALARWWSDAEDYSLLEAAPCSILAACDPGSCDPG